MATVMTFAAHPTKYKGHVFRSRLEARWAAFFDLACWRWEYEPFDLEGWVPDFTLVGPHCDAVLVEVKPFLPFFSRQESTELQQVKSKIEGALRGSEWEAIILGATVFPGCGLLGKRHIEELSWAQWSFPGDTDYLRELWAEAGNLTRWTPNGK